MKARRFPSRVVLVYQRKQKIRARGRKARLLQVHASPCLVLFLDQKGLPFNKRPINMQLE